MEYNQLVGNNHSGSNLEPVELTSFDNNKKKKSKSITSSLIGNNYLPHSDDLSSQTLSSSSLSVQTDAIIRLRNIHKTYLLGLEGVPALRGVSVTINRGEFIVILGKSGGGKTSMLNIIGTIDKPTKGDIYIAGKRISNKTTDSEVANLRLKNIGFCFQTFNLIGSMTALENVELPMILHGTLSSSQIRERAKKLLVTVGLGDRCNHLPSQLSGGEQQRVTISRAIANKPDVLLLDEPTGDLDTKNSNIIMDLLIKLNREQNITCIFVTHDVSLKYFAHRVIHMLDGKISKIEIISKKKRQNMERELRENMLNGDGVKKEESENKKVSEVREPKSFYPYLTFKKQYDEKQKVLKEKRRKKRAMRRQKMGSDYDEDEEEDTDESDNEIVGDEFDEMKADENGNEIEEIELEQAERRSSHHTNTEDENISGADF